MKTIPAIIALALSGVADAQTLNWLKQFGGSSYDNATAMTIDPMGNIILASSYNSTFEFEPGSGQFLSPVDSLDVYVAKLTQEGTLVWVVHFGGIHDDLALSAAADAQGNVYVTGAFEGVDVDFDPGPGYHPLTSSNGPDAFVMKFDADGGFVWAFNFGGAVDQARNVVVDDQANLYITGCYGGLTDVDPGPDEHLLPLPGGDNAYVLSLDHDGAFRWAVAFEGNEEDVGNSIALDPSGNVYVVGIHGGEFDLNPGPGVVPIAAGAYGQSFIVKLDPTGNYIWSATISSLGGAGLGVVAADGDGNAHAAGSFSGAAVVTTADSSTSLPNQGNSDAIALKLDPDGNLEWTALIAGPQQQYCGAIRVSSEGKVFLGGYVRNPAVVDFDPGPGSLFLGPSTHAMYLVILDANGQLECAAATTTANTDWDYCQEVGLTTDGNLIMYGDFDGTTDFDLGPGSADLTSAGLNDAFLLSMTTECQIILHRPELEVNRLAIAPNPCDGIVRIQGLGQLCVIEMYNAHGQIVLQGHASASGHTIDARSLKDGIYLLRARDARGDELNELLMIQR